MRPETGTQQAPSPRVSILFHIFSAMHCGAVLLDAAKRILRLNDQAQKHLGEALSTTQGRLCATDRGCDALFQTMLDQALKYGERERDWRREASGLKRDDKRPVIALVIPVAGDACDLLDGMALLERHPIRLRRSRLRQDRLGIRLMRSRSGCVGWRPRGLGWCAPPRCAAEFSA